LLGKNRERGSLGGAPPDDLLVRLRGRRSVRGNGGWARAPAFVAGFGQTAWLSIERLTLGPQLGDPRLDVEPFPSPKARGQRPD